MKKSVVFLSYIIGVLFLVSGLSKVINVLGFQNLIAQYGFPSLSFLGPFIVLAEITLGVAFVLNIKTRLAAILSSIMLILFSAAYVYGNLSHGITDCGCFGNIIKTESATLVYVRNLLLIGITVFIFCNTKDENYQDIPSWKKSILLTVLLPSIFIAGMTSRMFPPKRQMHPFINKTINQTLLKDYAVQSKEKELLMFISYGCPHCMNSIENFKAYKENNAVDTTLCYVITNIENVDNDSVNKTFTSHFPDVAFTEINNIEFVSAFPTAFYIENDTIREVIIGELPSPFVLFR